MQFFTSFLILFYLWNIFHVVNPISQLYNNQKLKTRKVRVAVCVTGQIDRWIPDQHLPNLIRTNPNVYFSFFFNFQYANRHYNVEYNVKYGIPSNQTQKEFWEAVELISNMHTSENSEVVTFKFDAPRNITKWQKLMRRPLERPMDRIYEYAKRQHIILNMYKNHLNCMKEIVKSEKNLKKKFDYIIISREDIFYFRPMNLIYTFEALNNPSCGLVAKDCIANYGINMRMQIATRDKGIKIFGSKIEFYESLFKNRMKVKNPEGFEYLQVKSYGLRNCALPVDLFPITAGRIHPNGSVCLLEKEVQSIGKKHLHSCLPRGYIETAQNLRCTPYQIKPLPRI